MTSEVFIVERKYYFGLQIVRGLPRLTSTSREIQSKGYLTIIKWTEHHGTFWGEGSYTHKVD